MRVNHMTDQTMAALMDAPQERQIGFSRYQSLLIALLAFTQFTIILDFIIMSPLDRRPVDRGDHRHRVRDAAGQRAFATEAGWESVPAFDRDRRAAALHAGLRSDDAAGDRRLRADAVQQRLYRAQSWHRHRAPSDNLSRLRSVYHCHGAPGRPGERHVRQVSDLCLGSVVSVIMVLIYTHLGQVSLTTAIIVNVLMLVGIFSRMIPSQALMSAIPEQSQRGSFSAVSASLQQLSGGLGSALAAAIIAQEPDGSLIHFDRLGYIVVTTSIVLMIAMYFVEKSVARRTGKGVV